MCDNCSNEYSYGSHKNSCSVIGWREVEVGPKDNWPIVSYFYFIFEYQNQKEYFDKKKTVFETEGEVEGWLMEQTKDYDMVLWE